MFTADGIETLRKDRAGIALVKALCKRESSGVILNELEAEGVYWLLNHIEDSLTCLIEGGTVETPVGKDKRCTLGVVTDATAP